MQIGQQGDGKVGIRAFFVNNDWIVPDGHLSAMKKSVYAGSKDRKGNKAPADGQLFWKGREHGVIADIPEAGQGKKTGGPAQAVEGKHQQENVEKQSQPEIADGLEGMMERFPCNQKSEKRAERQQKINGCCRDPEPDGIQHGGKRTGPGKAPGKDIILKQQVNGR